MTLNNAKDIALRTIQIELDAVSNLKNNVDDEFSSIVNEILESDGKIVITGMGKSGIVGSKIAATLASTGTPSFFMHPGEAFHGDLGMVEPKDIVIAISYSGESDEVLKLIPFFKDNGNTIISMSGNNDSTLAVNSNYHLNISVPKEACPLELAPTSSTTATMVLGDALAVVLMEMRGFKKENFARFHPGGSLGRKLLVKAENIMRTKNLPIVSPSETMINIIHSITNGRLGVVIIKENDTICGVITDGDMRREFEKSEVDAFSKTAAEIMTNDPICISKNEKLSTVQELFIDNKISSVLVTEKGDQKDLLGVIQVYDIK